MSWLRLEGEYERDGRGMSTLRRSTSLLTTASEILCENWVFHWEFFGILHSVTTVDTPRFATGLRRTFTIILDVAAGIIVLNICVDACKASLPVFFLFKRVHRSTRIEGHADEGWTWTWESVIVKHILIGSSILRFYPGADQSEYCLWTTSAATLAMKQSDTVGACVLWATALFMPFCSMTQTSVVRRLQVPPSRMNEGGEIAKERHALILSCTLSPEETSRPLYPT